MKLQNKLNLDNCWWIIIIHRYFYSKKYSNLGFHVIFYSNNKKLF